MLLRRLILFVALFVALASSTALAQGTPGRRQPGSYVTDARQILTTSPLTGGGRLGANLTLACPTCLTSSGGAISFTLNAIGTAQTPVLTLLNTTAAAAGAQQFSPMGSYCGRGWSGAASQSVCYSLQMRPVDSTAWGGSLVLWHQVGAAAQDEVLKIEYGSIVSGSTVLKCPSTAYCGLLDGNQNGVATSTQSVYFAAGGIGNVLRIDGTQVIPYTRFQVPLGNLNSEFSDVWSRRYAGVEQTIPAASTVTIDPGVGGEAVRLALSATAISAGGISLGTLQPAEQFKLSIIQDATGGRALTQANFSSSWVFQGGAYSVSAGANKRDILTFCWDTVAAKAIECAGRSLNL